MGQYSLTFNMSWNVEVAAVEEIYNTQCLRPEEKKHQRISGRTSKVHGETDRLETSVQGSGNTQKRFQCFRLLTN